MTPRLFRGTVAASALVFDERALGPAEAQRRALACWIPGARLRRTQIGLTLTLPAPKRITVAAAPGLPLVALGGALVGFETTIAAVRALGVSAGGLVVVRGGRIDVVPEGEDLAPHDWIALGRVTVVDTRALSTPRPITLAAPAPMRPRTRCSGRRSRPLPRRSRPSCATRAPARTRVGSCRRGSACLAGSDRC